SSWRATPRSDSMTSSEAWPVSRAGERLRPAGGTRFGAKVGCPALRWTAGTGRACETRTCNATATPPEDDEVMGEERMARREPVGAFTLAARHLQEVPQ